MQCKECGREIVRTGKNQKFCTECKKKNHQTYVKEYNKEYRQVIKKRYRKEHPKAVKEKPVKEQPPSNLDKAVAFYGPYGLELVQSFFNILHRASVIAKKNGRVVDGKALDVIMNDFRQNKIG